MTFACDVDFVALEQESEKESKKGSIIFIYSEKIISLLSIFLIKPLINKEADSPREEKKIFLKLVVSEG